MSSVAHKISDCLLLICGVLAVELAAALASFAIFDSPIMISHAESAPAAVSVSVSTKAIWQAVFPGQDAAGIPVRLKIPKIGVDAAFESVGLTAQGAVGVPVDFSHVAWLNSWPRPGAAGSAVVTGHYGRKNGKGSVFDRLSALAPGDLIYVENGRGQMIAFAVRELRSYGEHDDVPEIFASADGLPHLNLITCEGIWNSATKSYSKRLVVFADLQNK